MNSRFVLGVAVLGLLASACGLGDKEAHADRIVDAGDALMASRVVTADIAVAVKVLPSDRKLVVQDAPRIAPGSLSRLASTLHPVDNDASVAGVVRFVDNTIYERIAPKTAQSSALGAVVAPNNLQAIVGAITGAAISPGEVAAAPTTTAPRTLRRSVQIVREWAAFDFAKIADHDSTKHAGSFALNPVAVLRLTTGVLTGSIEQDGLVFHANVSRDKAERKLNEDARDVLDKMFIANAITRRVFPATFTFDRSGRLSSFSVTMRQQLTSKDRADLTVVMRFGHGDATSVIQRPARRGTVTVNTLGELATTVSGA